MDTDKTVSKNTDIEGEKENQENKIDFSKQKGNYIIRVMSDNKLVRQIYVANSTINVLYAGDLPLALDIK